MSIIKKILIGAAVSGMSVSAFAGSTPVSTVSGDGSSVAGGAFTPTAPVPVTVNGNSGTITATQTGVTGGTVVIGGELANSPQVSAINGRSFTIGRRTVLIKTGP